MERQNLFLEDAVISAVTNAVKLLKAGDVLVRGIDLFVIVIPSGRIYRGCVGKSFTATLLIRSHRYYDYFFFGPAKLPYIFL